MEEREQAKLDAQADVKRLEKLKQLSNNEEVQELFNLMLEECAQKMVLAFTGNGVTDWDSYCKARGQIVSDLALIQQIKGADAQIKTILEQLKNLYDV